MSLSEVLDSRHAIGSRLINYKKDLKIKIPKNALWKFYLNLFLEEVRVFWFILLNCRVCTSLANFQYTLYMDTQEV